MLRTRLRSQEPFRAGHAAADDCDSVDWPVGIPGLRPTVPGRQRCDNRMVNGMRSSGMPAACPRLRRPLRESRSMSGNTLGTLFRVTNFGESHGPAIGAVIDGCPPGLALSEADIQAELDRRRPGTSRHVTQRREPDTVEILSGVFEGATTGTPIGLLIRN